MIDWRRNRMRVRVSLCIVMVTAAVSVAAEDTPWWTFEGRRFTNREVGYSLTVPDNWTMKAAPQPDAVTFVNMEVEAFFMVKRFEMTNRLEAMTTFLLGGARIVFGEKLGEKPVIGNIKTVAGSEAQELLWRMNDAGGSAIVRDICIDRDPADTVVIDIIFVMPKSAKRKLNDDMETVLSSFTFEQNR